MTGFLDLSAFGECYRNSGNLGMADLVAALQWIHENIRNFGGDAENVTIYGQSGGGGKVKALMQMPAADGLYKKAIIQSRIIDLGMSDDDSETEKVGVRVADQLGLTRTNISEIERVDYEILGKAVKTVYQELGINTFTGWAPKPDGDYYLGDAMKVGFRTKTKNIPLIAGSCLAEFLPIPAGDKNLWTREQRLAIARERFGKEAEAALESFTCAYPEIDEAYVGCVDYDVRSATLRYLNRRNQELGAENYNYIFAFESPLQGGQLTGHNGDIHFVFHNAAHLPALYRKNITETIQNAMAGAWTQFARNGVPNGETIPEWKPYTKENGMTMIYSDTARMAEHHDERLLQLLENIVRNSGMSGLAANGDIAIPSNT